MRVALKDGLADLRTAAEWDMGFVRNATRPNAYQEMANKIVSSLGFIETCGLELDPVLRSVDFFTSHEGLHLEYEEAMTSPARAASAPASGEAAASHYNLGAHLLWIGDRTRQLDHAHVEYFRGIANPVGVKVGPTTVPHELITLIRRLWPDPAATPGKITLITRFGACLLYTSPSPRD